MKGLISLLLIVILSLFFTEKPKYAGTWYNDSNFCDSLVVTKNKDKLVAAFSGRKYPAEVKDGHLEIYSKKLLRGSITSEDELEIAGKTYSKAVSDYGFSIEGNWNIFECSKQIEYGAYLSIEGDEITIRYGSPVTIYGKLDRTKKGIIPVTFDYTDASPSFYRVAGDLDRIDKDKPIAYIVLKSKNHFNFIWEGITLKGKDRKWLHSLDDDSQWGANAVLNNNVITYIRE